MIDRQSRNALMVLLQQLAAQRIGVAEYARHIEFHNSGDLGIREIYRHTLTTLEEAGSYKRLDTNGKSLVDRSLLFLKSDNKFQWEPYPKESRWTWLIFSGAMAILAGAILGAMQMRFVAGCLFGVAIVLIMFGQILVWRASTSAEQAWRRKGDFEVWPFRWNSEYSRAIGCVGRKRDERAG